MFNKKLKYFIIVIILAITVCFNLCAAEDIVVATEKDNNAKITVTEGDTLIVRLKYTSGTGYTWKIVKNNTDVLRLVGDSVFEVPEKSMPGASGTQVFKFKAKSKGSVTLELHYLRPWEKNTPPADTYCIKVKVLPVVSIISKVHYRIIADKIDKKTKDYSIKIRYPQIKDFFNKATQEKFNKIVTDYINKNIKQFKKGVRDFALKTELKEYLSSLYLDFDIKFQSNHLISLVFSGEIYYRGAAHPGPVIYTLNYDLKNDRKLKLADLFKSDSDYLKVVSKYCIDYLSKKKISDSDWINRGASAKESNYRYFYLTSENLVVVFPQYQVASYAAGVQEVSIPYSCLKDIIDSKGPIGTF